MKNKKEKSMDIIIFQILLFILLIFILMYVFIPKYRVSVNKDLSRIFNTNFDEKTKFLDELNKKDTKKEENKNETSKENINKEAELKEKDKEEKEKSKEKQKENKEAEKNAEISKEKEEVVIEKTDEEKALELVNKKHNSSGAFMSYVMDKKPGRIYIVGLSDPETTNLKGIFEVNLNTKTVEESN